MKNTLLLSTLFMFFCLQLQGQNKPLKTDSFNNPLPTKQQNKNTNTVVPNSNARTIGRNKTNKVSPLSFQRISGKESISIDDLKSRFGLSPSMSLKEFQVTTDKLGIKHESFQQHYKGLPIDGFLLFKHNGKETILHGQVAEIKDLDVNPTIDESEAKDNAMRSLGVNSVLQDYPIELKVIESPNNKNEFELAYEVRIDAVNPLLMKKVFVSAKTGEILNTIELIPHADTPGTANTFYSGTQDITIDEISGTYRLREAARKIETYDATNAEFTNSGIEGSSDFINSSSSWTGFPYLSSFTISEASTDWWFNSIIDTNADFYIVVKDGDESIVYQSNYVNNTNVPVTFQPNLLLSNGPYSVEIWDYDAADSDDFGGTYTITSTVGTQNYADNSNSGSYVTSELNNPALDVHWGMEVTYDFFLDVFDRDSYDGNGGVIKQYLNPPDLQAEFGNSPNNAFAAGSPYNIMVYGLGDGVEMGPVVGLDVEGHEFSHLVVGNNGNGGLEYQGESGALNESFADIFGVCVEFYSGFNPDWTMGEGIMISEPYLRSMSNPNGGQQPDTYEGQYWVNPENLSYDHGGVHINSGVQNFWFYLLSEGDSGTNDLGNSFSVSGIGIEKARQIAYRNLVTYLGPNATYYDSYLGSLQSAEDIYGNPSAEYDAVKAAWYAVGIGNAPDATCEGTTTLTASSRTITDGSGAADYGNNLNCTWLIAPSGANQITIDFTQFDTEPEYDTVFVYDGPTENHEVLMTWWGNTLPPQITSTGGAALIRFSSDINTTASGWSANYTSSGSSPSCDGLNFLTNNEGTIDDGSGSSAYGNNQECFWYIAPPCASSVTLSFSAFDTEEDYDGLIVYDGIDSDASELAILSGTTIPNDITSTTGEMLLVFVSDYAVTQPGFSASYTSNGIAFCSGTNEISDSDSGIISDGSGNENYCNNQECSWLISPPDAEKITLYFSKFDLEEPSEDGRTIYDAIEIYDGTSESAELIGTYSGNELPPPITSSGGEILIKFFSDFSVNEGGWELEYVTETERFCSGMQTLVDFEGEFSDGSSENYYGNNSVCSWLIQPEGASKINLSFSEFDLEEDYDAVIVYDGDDSSAPVLATLSGSDLPNIITSTDGALYMEFLSDPTIRKSGWKATYSSEQILGVDNEFFKDIKLYPNPVSNFLTIENSKHDRVKVIITDMTGHESFKTELNKGKNEIDIKSLAPGFYLLNFQTHQKTFLYKIMVK